MTQSTGRRLGRLATAAMLVLLGAVSACGDDDEDGGSGTVGPDGSANLPTHDQLQAALDFAQDQGQQGLRARHVGHGGGQERHRPRHRLHRHEDRATSGPPRA